MLKKEEKAIVLRFPSVSKVEHDTWTITEVRGERVLNWKAVAWLVVKVVIAIAVTVTIFSAISYGIDKEYEYNNNVLNSHISASQRADVIERGNRQ